ncbi:PTS sugar transporter subunit IIA [Gulosibacter chungangensis]|uniref:Ascorbate-specific PTS system EIIA component n=1 Tax=Gulosibacter chungangensis TaxID=979746 RepID=A0A7J5B9T2_9MICO|nr:PTS sugar transporter subunit IIA [Gulosibacter chungangensis]KAB1641885.1 PTS sugar transporter subunit IIA [Gulosibacter chungangensis]
MSDDVLPASAIRFNAEASNWQQAITISGDLLVESGATTEDYTAAMVQTVEELGPYMVIAPGFALAHARPSEAVHHTGLSWVTLAQPVEFGSEANDPVDLVVGLAALDHDSHIQVMSKLARVLATPEVLARLRASNDPEEIRAALLGE